MRQRSGLDIKINASLHVARWKSGVNRRIYSMLLPIIANRQITQCCSVDAVVCSFSSDRDVPEQIASIRSFIRNVGRPHKFIVVSDGSHSNRNRALICNADSCVQVVTWNDFTRVDIPKSVMDYATISPMGKKLAVLMSTPANCTVIYADSDIIFFPQAAELAKVIQSEEKWPIYIQDCQPTFDNRIITVSEMAEPVNAGFAMLKCPLNWQLAVERLEQLRDAPVHFTEQTLVHLAIHANGGKSLNPEQYVVQLSDAYIAHDLYSDKNIALRHYAGPTRYKLWRLKL